VVRTSLDGDDWQLRPCLGDEWQWHVGPDKPWDAPGWTAARVPGSVLDDLVRAGEAPSPYHERDSLACEWVSERAWLYRRRVVFDAPLLRFAGVDHTCTVLVDGDVVAEHAGMFAPFDVDVRAYADGRERLLAVVVHPAPPSEPQVGRTSRVRVHKARMDYGWDFCPRLVHQGIWRSVSLVDEPERFPLVRLTGGVGTVELDGEVVLRVEQPELWWPNGMGEQPLYDVAGFRVGFRTVELDGYRVVVNGVPMYVKGWNWCPLDPLYGVPRPEKLERLLRLAHDANVNMLRVWGGGLIESTQFYETCDRLGILVWQEFSQSSSGIESVPAADDEFVSLMRDEARAIVPRRRRHPSLALWCAGNELAADDSHPVVAALRIVVRELDPDRGWLPTSPSERDGARDAHGPWEHQGLRDHYRLYDSGDAVLHSEFGVEGMANRAALEELVDASHRWPADRSNPVYEHLGAWWNNAPLVQACFGNRLADVETLRRASQWLQYDGLRYAVEANMRRAGSVGVLPWQFAESFPNAWCTSAVDWRAQPKPAYWGVARAFRPGHPSARFATCAWGGERAARARIHGGVPARFVRLDGEVVAEARDEISAPLDELGDVFVLDLAGRNRYVMTAADTLAPLLDLPRTDVAVERASNGLLRARNRGPVAALGLVLEGDRDTFFSDNVLDLLPGETREIAIDGELVGWEAWNASP
jgi:beta-mannosidase